MKNKKNLGILILTFSGLILIFGCGQVNMSNADRQTDNLIVKNQSLTIDTFSNFPPEIDGCCCYFSKDSNDFKNNKYIYVNDYAQTSFLKINGVLIKFTQTDFKELGKGAVAKYKSVDYEMTIKVIDGIQNGDETWLKSGTIVLKDKKGKTVTKTFYGECGC